MKKEIESKTLNVRFAIFAPVGSEEGLFRLAYSAPGNLYKTREGAILALCQVMNATSPSSLRILFGCEPDQLRVGPVHVGDDGDPVDIFCEESVLTQNYVN